MFPAGIGNVSNEVIVEFNRIWIRCRNDEYVSIGSSLPAFVMTWDHFFGDSFGTKDVREYLKIYFCLDEKLLDLSTTFCKNNLIHF